MRIIANFWQDEAGLELSEYAVATSLMALAVVVVMTNLGSAVSTRISQLTSTVSS